MLFQRAEPEECPRIWTGVTRRPYRTLMRELVFAPAGMAIGTFGARPLVGQKVFTSSCSQDVVTSEDQPRRDRMQRRIAKQREMVQEKTQKRFQMFLQSGCRCV